MESKWFETTISSLTEHNYEYIIMPSTPKTASVPGGNASEIIRATGLRLRHPNPGALGCWVSHLRAWSLQSMFQRPVISLEADTKARLPWDAIKTKQWQNYDILFLHDHPNRAVPCSRDSEILTGLPSRYATGAMFFTGRTQLSKVIELIDTSLPIGHWLNLMDRTHKLNIGTLCPSLFGQRTDKSSQISP